MTIPPSSRPSRMRGMARSERMPWRTRCSRAWGATSFFSSWVSGIWTRSPPHRGTGARAPAPAAAADAAPTRVPPGRGRDELLLVLDVGDLDRLANHARVTDGPLAEPDRR